MASLTMVLKSTNLVLFLIIGSAQAYKVNITKFGNCDDVGEVKVKLTSVVYDYNDEGLCDTVHGTYYVSTKESGLDYELWMTLFQCPTTSVSQCNDNARNHLEPLRCHEGGFRASTTGPWYMLAKGLRGSQCGEKVGEFELKSAQLLPEYLANYLVVDPNLARNRIQMLFHKTGDTECKGMR